MLTAKGPTFCQLNLTFRVNRPMAIQFANNSWEASDLQYHFHGFSDIATLKDAGPIIISGGKGVYVFDTKGKSYLEANSGLWNFVAGFDNAELIEVAREQYTKLPGYHAFFGRVSDTAVELSEKVIEVSPFDEGKVFFTNSGSEANETAVKMLWMLSHGEGNPHRRKIITRVNAYHGVTVVASSMTAKPYNSVFGLPLDGFLHSDCPHYWRFAQPEESEAAFTNRITRSLEELIEREGPETIAGFFAEPVMGAGGVIPPSAGYFDAIQPILKRYSIPLVADEVITGFGRTGELWGSTSYDMEPDIIIASKCITAGYFPMGAVILSGAIAKRLNEISAAAEEFPHGFASAAHPVGCAIASKAIELIVEGGLLDNAREVSTHFHNRLKEFESHPFIGEVRGVGLMAALEVVRDKASKTPFDSALGVSEAIANAALENGLICRPLGQAVVLCPPFIITHDELDELFSRLHASLESVFSRVG